MSDAAAIADYLKRNRTFHRPTEPIRTKEHYTELYWRRAIRVIRREFQRDISVKLILCLQGDPNRVIGIVNFSQIFRGPFQACFLGYALDKQHEGKGLMTEALRLAVDYMFMKRNLHRVMANYMPRNAKSARVLKMLGFQIDGSAKAYLLINGKWEDHVMTSLVNRNWQSLKK